MPPLILLRHATCGAPPGHCLGQRDLPLDAPGREAVRALRQNWQQGWPERVACSDLARARETAERLVAGTGAAITRDPRLREISLGAWEGRCWDALYREQPSLLAHWGEHWLEVAPPGGESGKALFARVAHWYRDWQASGAPPCLVVAHAGSLRALACLAQGRGPEALFDCHFEHCAPLSLL